MPRSTVWSAASSAKSLAWRSASLWALRYGRPITLATLLAYASGMILGLVPVMRSRGIGLVEAFRIIWVGEVVSIGVMELVMNVVDYQMDGMSAPSIASWMCWRGLLFAVPAGFLAAWPVNYWLLKCNLKACH